MLAFGTSPFSITPAIGTPPVLNIQSEGMDSMVGCPCCCPISTQLFQTQYFIPPECTNLISAAELSRLVEEGNHILKTTHMPVFPIICMHFCIPFSPLCILACYANSRQEKLREMCRKWNDKVFMERNCHM